MNKSFFKKGNNEHFKKKKKPQIRKKKASLVNSRSQGIKIIIILHSAPTYLIISGEPDLNSRTHKTAPATPSFKS